MFHRRQIGLREENEVQNTDRTPYPPGVLLEPDMA